MKGLFVDTAGWAAFLVRSEAFHDQAVFLLEHARENGQPILTTSYVIAELIALLTSPIRVRVAATKSELSVRCVPPVG